jgi:hypothetical protein
MKGSISHIPSSFFIYKLKKKRNGVKYDLHLILQDFLRFL